MNGVFKILVDIYTPYTAALVVGSGVFAYFMDQKKLLKKKLKKEAKISKIMGLIYCVGGLLLYIVVSILA